MGRARTRGIADVPRWYDPRSPHVMIFSRVGVLSGDRQR